MAARKLWLLDCGRLVVDQSVLTYLRDAGQKVEIPVMAAVVETDEGYLLFDTGLDPQAHKSGPSVFGEKASVVSKFAEENDVREQLSSIGIGISDVRWVVNSHLHWDHTGANRYFASAEFIIQREELRFARDPDQFVTPVYLQHQFDLDRDCTVIDGSHRITDGVAVINTRGHTPGHQSLVAQLPDTGCLVISGDALYCDDNLDALVPPGNPWDMREAYRSITEIRFWRDYHRARVVIGHDPKLWDTYRIRDAYT